MPELRLHARQGEAYLSPATEILYGGAAGGGKSHLMRVAAISWCIDIPGLQVYLMRRTYPDLAANHLEGPGGLRALLAPYTDARQVVIVSGSTPEVRFSNGSRIFLRHCQLPRDVHHYQGAEMHVLMIDELTQWQEDMYRYLRGRVRMAGVRVPPQWDGRFPRILCSSNPGGIGHNWVKSAWIDIAPPGEITDMPIEEGGLRRQYIPARLDDNPTLQQQDPHYLDRLTGLGSPELVQALRDGSWDIVAGGIIDDLWRPARHIVDMPDEIPRGWRIDRSFDWGSARPFSVGWWAESDGSPIRIKGRVRHWPPGTLLRIGEWYGWDGTPDRGCRMVDVEIARGILERERDMGIADRVVPGPADSSIFDQINVDSVADRMARAGVEWVPADKRPGSRVRGWELLRRRLAASLVERGEPIEEPALFIVKTCRQWIRTVPVLPRDDHKQDDVDTQAEDHIGDETRYRLLARADSRDTRQVMAHVR